MFTRNCTQDSRKTSNQKVYFSHDTWQIHTYYVPWDEETSEAKLIVLVSQNKKRMLKKILWKKGKMRLKNMTQFWDDIIYQRWVTWVTDLSTFNHYYGEFHCRDHAAAYAIITHRHSLTHEVWRDIARLCRLYCITSVDWLIKWRLISKAIRPFVKQILPLQMASLYTELEVLWLFSGKEMPDKH